MLHIEDKRVRQRLLQGNFGLEMESLRVTADGHLSHGVHPFDVADHHIVRDFCENQTEINTSVHKSIDDVMNELAEHRRRIVQKLSAMPEPELLWPFSNPPYIINEEDVPVAQFYGADKGKTSYRNMLSDKYGRYKMTLSGIHFNYSFAGDLLRDNYEAETGIRVYKDTSDVAYREYLDKLYLTLAHHSMTYGWLLVALTAASPLLDSSYFCQGESGGDIFLGMSSVRCSEQGYWNYFTPVLDYTNVQTYTDSIQRYVDLRLINAPSELYYPVRLKPRGVNSLETLRRDGVNHIELRCIDLNPLTTDGVDARDIRFAQLLLVWLASMPSTPFGADEQTLAVQNYKTAAHFDLRTCKVTLPDVGVMQADEAIRLLLHRMDRFYSDVYQTEAPDVLQGIHDLIQFQLSKIDAPYDNSYAWIVRRDYSEGFVTKGVERAKYITRTIK